MSLLSWSAPQCPSSGYVEDNYINGGYAYRSWNTDNNKSRVQIKFTNNTNTDIILKSVSIRVGSDAAELYLQESLGSSEWLYCSSFEKLSSYKEGAVSYATFTGTLTIPKNSSKKLKVMTSRTKQYNGHIGTGDYTSVVVINTDRYAGSPTAPTWLIVSSPIYYGGTYYMSAPTSYTEYRYRKVDGNWEVLSDSDSNGWRNYGYNSYGTSSSPANAWTYSAVQWRVRNYDENYETGYSDWTYSDIIQYTLNIPTISIESGSSTSPVLYGNYTKLSASGIEPSDVTYNYEWKDDSRDWATSTVSTQINAKQYYRVYASHSYFNSSGYSGTLTIECKLNAPSSCSFSINPRTVSSINTISGTAITDNGESLVTGFNNTTSIDSSNGLIPSTATLYIKNSVDDTYKTIDSASITTWANYNGAIATAKYVCSGYVDSDETSSDSLIIKDAPEILSSTFNINYLYDNKILVQDTIIIPGTSIRVNWSALSSTLNYGRFNWVRVYAVNQDRVSTLVAEDYTYTWKAETDEYGIDVSLGTAGNPKVTLGQLYSLKLVPCYIDSQGNVIESNKILISLESNIFLFGGKPSNISLVYPQSFAGNSLATLSNRIPICFKSPNPGAGAKNIVDISITCTAYDESTLGVLRTETITISNPSTTSELEFFLMSYNTLSSVYTQYEYTDHIPEGTYVTIAFKRDNTFVQDDYETPILFKYEISCTNDIGLSTDPPVEIYITRLSPVLSSSYKSGSPVSYKDYNKIRDALSAFINYYKPVLKVDPIDFNNKYPLATPGNTIILASTVKEWLRDYILLLCNTNGDNTGGFPHMGSLPNSSTMLNMTKSNPLETDTVNPDTVVIADQNYKLDLNKGQGMYYDIILKMFVDNI